MVFDRRGRVVKSPDCGFAIREEWFSTGACVDESLLVRCTVMLGAMSISVHIFDAWDWESGFFS